MIDDYIRMRMVEKITKLPPKDIITLDTLKQFLNEILIESRNKKINKIKNG